MKRRTIVLLVLAIWLAACETASRISSSATPESAIPKAASFISGDGVEIALEAKFNGVTSEHCLDIAGGIKNVDPGNGLQAHTCYSYQGELGSDQTFDSSKFSGGILYMPIYDVCVELTGLEAGSRRL